MFDIAGKRIFVAGHRGMVGSALVRRLKGEDCEIVTAGRAEVDLRDQAATRAFVLDRRRTPSSSPRPASAASSPTTHSRPTSSTTTS